MKRKIELLMGLCVILCAFVLARKGAVFVQSEQAKSAPVCIVVDAGHGGDDPGKIGINDALEKDINLQIALKLQKILDGLSGAVNKALAESDTVRTNELSRDSMINMPPRLRMSTLYAIAQALPNGGRVVNTCNR